jgi:hypothetical protein
MHSVHLTQTQTTNFHNICTLHNVHLRKLYHYIPWVLEYKVWTDLLPLTSYQSKAASYGTAASSRIPVLCDVTQRRWLIVPAGSSGALALCRTQQSMGKTIFTDRSMLYAFPVLWVQVSKAPCTTAAWGLTINWGFLLQAISVCLTTRTRIVPERSLSNKPSCTLVCSQLQKMDTCPQWNLSLSSNGKELLILPT